MLDNKANTFFYPSKIKNFKWNKREFSFLSHFCKNLDDLINKKSLRLILDMI